jgi:hypothetical protein
MARLTPIGSLLGALEESLASFARKKQALRMRAPQFRQKQAAW